MAQSVKTTLELEKPLYTRLRKLAVEEGKTLKKLMDEILMLGLSRKDAAAPVPFSLPKGQALGARVALEDKDLVAEILSRDQFRD